jgi:Ca2+-binding EF-hand superfamily protein
VAPNPRAQKALQTIKAFIARSRIHILPPFQDFDRAKRGYVTELQFGRVLSVMRVPVPEMDVPLLIDIYKQPMGIDYYKFVEDVDPLHGQQRRSFKPVGRSKQSILDVFGHTPSGDDFITADEADALIYKSKHGLLPKLHERQNVNELLRAIQHWAYIHSVHFQDFLKDYDPLNSGEITCNKFRGGMLMAGYRLTNDEYDILTEAYKSTRKEGYIRWRQFADDVMSFVAPKTLERMPTLVPLKPSELSAKTISERTQKAIPTPQVERVLKVINRFVIARKIPLREQFLDKDPHNHEQVSVNSFTQVIQLMGVHLCKAEIDLLCHFYIDVDTHFVRYPDFIDDVIAIGGIDFGENSPTKLVVNPRPDYSIDIQKYVATCPKISAEQLHWRALLPKIQSFVLKRRIRIVEFFENFDRLSHGIVTIQKFRSVAGQLDLPLSEDELQFVSKLFALESKPDLFNYKLFCDQINEIFGVPKLHRTPSRDATCRAAYLPDPSTRLNEMSPEAQRKVDKIIQRMQHFVSTRRVECRHQFDDYDKAPHRNYVTKAQFKQCVGRLGLTNDDEELELLCQRYRCTDLDEQNYLAFVNDIEATCNWTWPIPDDNDQQRF